MPCRYDPTPQEIAEARERQEKRIADKAIEPFAHEIEALVNENEELKFINNLLSVKVDELHELILEWYQSEIIPIDAIDGIYQEQVVHRQKDLDRLLLSGKLSVDQIRRVAKANAQEPLEPQIGFNPDDY